MFVESTGCTEDESIGSTESESVVSWMVSNVNESLGTVSIILTEGGSSMVGVCVGFCLKTHEQMTSNKKIGNAKIFLCLLQNAIKPFGGIGKRRRLPIF